MFVGNNFLGQIVSFENVGGLVFTHNSQIFIFKDLSLVNNFLRLQQHNITFFGLVLHHPFLLCTPVES